MGVASSLLARLSWARSSPALQWASATPFGADRSTLAFICEAYTVDESRPSPEPLNFHTRLAPIKAAVFPLVNKDRQTKEDGTVTVRDRDTGHQDRIDRSRVVEYLEDQLSSGGLQSR